jgi:hypothetical protein
MLGLGIAAILVAVFDHPIAPPTEGESLGVVLEAAANIIATLLIIGVVSISSTLLSIISFLRRERPMAAAIALCLAVPALGVTILAMTRL